MLKILKNINVVTLTFPGKELIQLKFLLTNAGSICSFNGDSVTEDIADVMKDGEDAYEVAKLRLNILQRLTGDPMYIRMMGESESADLNLNLTQFKSDIDELGKILASLKDLHKKALQWDHEQVVRLAAEMPLKRGEELIKNFKELVRTLSIEDTREEVPSIEDIVNMGGISASEEELPPELQNEVQRLRKQGLDFVFMKVPRNPKSNLH